MDKFARDANPYAMNMNSIIQQIIERKCHVIFSIDKFVVFIYWKKKIVKGKKK